MDIKYWDKICENYNSEIFDVLKTDKSGIIKSYINQVASLKKTVGDFGCGIGKWLPLLSKQFKEVSAIDFSPSNMKFTEKKYKNLKNVNFITMDMTRTPKTAYKFDVILCVNAILTPNASKRNNFYKNIYANLKTSGHLILVVPAHESVLYSQFILEKLNRTSENDTKKAGSAVIKSEYDKFKKGVVNIDQVPTKHHLKEELISTLNENGFTITKIDKAEYPWNTEMENPPKSLMGPYPWDWVVVATKN